MQGFGLRGYQHIVCILRNTFFSGIDFPNTWLAPREIKVKSFQRFSPPGTIAHYFGLTVDATVSGLDRPVFYNTFDLSDAAVVKDLDGMQGLKHFSQYGSNEKEAIIFVTNQKYKIFLSAPR